MPNNLTNFPFDQFTRQAAVSDIIDATRKDKEKFSILDVGGYKGATAKFQSKDDVTILDVYDVDEPDYIKGDGTSLTFESDSYDYVVSFDALEHVKGEGREQFISEMIRVAKYGVILTFPLRNADNEAAERQLNKLYKKLYGKQHPWLKEHIDYVLPDISGVQKILDNKELKSRMLFSNRIDSWFALQSAMFITSANIDFAGSAMRKLNAEYNKVYSDHEGGERFYRTIAAGFKDKERHDMFDASYITHRPEAQSQPFDLLERINEFYIEVLSNMRLEITKRQYAVDEQLENNKRLQKSIDEIHNSKSYKIARSIQKSRAAVHPRRNTNES